MSKVYISGKITGLDLEYAKSLFDEAQMYLQNEYGCTIVNPMVAVPYKEGKTWEQYMLDDINLLFGCDAVFMLKNWEDSRGARVECSIAKEMSKTILFQD